VTYHSLRGFLLKEFRALVCLSQAFIQEEFFTELCDMQWAEPQYSIGDIELAGAILASHNPDSYTLDRAITIINNWRACHHFPLNTFQSTLRRKVEDFPDAVVVQRVKRIRAIQHKLRKHTVKPIALSEMQDIGGCRAVLKSAAHVKRLRDAYVKSDLKHDLIRENDYIKFPKYSGYRGIHLIYSYKSSRKATYNGLNIEVQLRTQLQNAWATAVEIVGFFRRELLKSGEGDNVWKQFFKLMAAEIAYAERAPFSIPGMPATRAAVREQLRRCEKRLHALSYLNTIGEGGVNVIEVDTSGAHYFLLELDTNEKRLKITGYKLNAREKATMDLVAVEKRVFGNSEHDAVLVSAQSMADLKRAYFNYFLDMHRFIKAVTEATS
jgi:ppGpp synthetase/RelA/SpoT-type nucleotidyltranferase